MSIQKLKNSFYTYLFVYAGLFVLLIQLIKFLIPFSGASHQALFVFNKWSFILQLLLITIAVISFLSNRNNYRFISVTITNAILILLVLNNIVWIGYRINTPYAPPHETPLQKYPTVNFQEIYQGMETSEIQELLNESWHRELNKNQDFVHFTEGPFNGKYVNVDSNAIRYNPAKPIIPLDTNYFNLFIYGGSTTFGYGVADNQTIPYYLQENFNQTQDSVRVYNLGQAYYFSIQERILFENHLLNGIKPDMVVFIDGLNDFHSLQETPVKFKTPVIKQTDTNILKNIPLVKFLLSFNKSHSESQEAVSKPTSQVQSLSASDEEKSADKLVQKYVANKTIVEQICSGEKIQCLFVVQPIPFYKYNSSYHKFYSPQPHSPARLAYSILDQNYHQNKTLENLLWLGNMQDTLNKNLYVDLVHYSPEMNKMIALKIYHTVTDKYTLEN